MSLSYPTLLQRSWPIMLASASAPLLSLVDTAIIGNSGNAYQLAGLAVAALVFNFIYWSLGFLRMGTTGFAAQYSGASHHQALWLLLFRGGALALVSALILITLQQPIYKTSLYLIAPPDNTISAFREYFTIRIWSSPATLITYVLSGILIGLGLSRHLLAVHLFLNGTNAIFDIVFASILGWGIEGIAWGTFLAEYLAMILALALVYQCLPKYRFSVAHAISELKQKKQFFTLMSVNSDIFLRTIALLIGFAWFTHIGASLGTDILAANYILLQFISFSAFFLDGYAHVLESIAGKAIGRGSPKALMDSIKKTSTLALITAIILSGVILFIGERFILLLSNIQPVINYATEYLPLASLYILLSCAAFQLDGLFIGATYSRAMRNASIISTLLFIAAWKYVFYPWHNLGLWYSFIFFVVIRALMLMAFYPSLIKRVYISNND